ncbi:hypothetical protein KP509_1Z093600 [Ceratopteris richardii]|nr:hypothetical protein KP509_1Z093600 [Ceratopteris richardii]
MGGYFHDTQIPAQYIDALSVEGHDSRDAPVRKISRSAETSHEHTARHPAHAEPGIPRTSADYPKPTSPSASANTTQPQDGAAKPTVLLIVALILQILAIISLFATMGLIASAAGFEVKLSYSSFTYRIISLFATMGLIASAAGFEVKLSYSSFTPISVYIYLMGFLVFDA